MRTQAICLTVVFVLLCGQAYSQWVHMDGTHGNVNCFARCGPNLYAGTEVNGVLRSTDNGLRWTTINSGLSDSSVTCLAVSGVSIFVGTYYGKVFRSTDYGLSWSATTQGLPPSGWQCTSIVTSGTNILAGFDTVYNIKGPTGGRVFLSTDNGTNWMATNHIFDGVNLFADGVRIYANGFYRGNGSGGGEPGIFLSTNNGTTWSPVSSGLSHRALLSMSTFGFNTFAGTDSGLFVSTNGGTDWLASGMNGCSVSALAQSGTNFFTAACLTETPLGHRWFVRRIVDNGASWTPVDWLGFPHGYVFFPFTLTGDEVSVLIGTPAADYGDIVIGGGVWRRPLSEIVSVSQAPEFPKAFRLDQNYPNPFNPSTTIRYSLPHKSQVLLTVYNTLGQQVAILVQAQQEAGSYEVKFDGSALASGMYFYRIQAGSYVNTKKLLLLK